MKQRVLNLTLVLAVAGAVVIGCGSDDDSSPGGTAGTSGAGGSGAKGGNAAGGNNPGGGSPGAGTGAGGSGNGGNGGGGAIGPGEAGMGGGFNPGPGGAGGEAGQGGANGYTVSMIAHGRQLVRSVALCGGCHTATNGMELAGNPAFKNSTLPAPNLTPDATGLGKWTDAQIINAIRNGKDDQNRQLDSAMPYWLFHNMSDSDVQSIVAFLRSLTPVVANVGANNPAATAVTPLAPGAFPASTLASTDANYAAAQRGLYLVSSTAQCVKCHSPATAGLPSGNFFSGVAPANNTTIFSSNITPDATGISGWSADDVATALKLGKDKANVTLCGSMPAAAKGYGGLTDADAHAIGVYLTTIPAVANAAAAPTLEPACP